MCPEATGKKSILVKLAGHLCLPWKAVTLESTSYLIGLIECSHLVFYPLWHIALCISRITVHIRFDSIYCICCWSLMSSILTTLLQSFFQDGPYFGLWERKTRVLALLGSKTIFFSMPPPTAIPTKIYGRILMLSHRRLDMVYSLARKKMQSLISV